jgi:predicted DNA-binding protein with PD1-like motif
MRTIAARLLDGQDLMREIKSLAEVHKIQAGVILSAVGSLHTSNIRVPVIDGEVKMIHPRNVEIDALQGTVSKNGCHLHIVVSDVEGMATGGHLKEGNIVRTTCEVVIGIVEENTFNREPDEHTGYDELVIRPKPS